jgi:hypothetical protein
MSTRSGYHAAKCAQRQRIYNIAAKHLQTVQACVDQLHELGANEELKLLTSRLQRLPFRSTPNTPAE